MIGLCIGLAVQAHMMTGGSKHRLTYSINRVMENMEISKRPVVFRRDETLPTAIGQSWQYYCLLDACPLRMQP